MVEAYTASWIEIPLSGNCSATEMSKPIRLRGLKSLPVRGKVSNGGVEAYTASWIEIAAYGCTCRMSLSKPIRLRGLKSQLWPLWKEGIPSKPIRLRGLKL